MMDEQDYESVLLVKPEVFVYKIPPRQSNRGYRAADWNLTSPDWSGRMRIISRGKKCAVKLEDKSGQLFAECPITEYPSAAVEQVMDSSRYFVIRIQDPSGRSAFIGIGFTDRSDSFDLNVTLQDHFKWVKQSENFAKEAGKVDNVPKLDLAFKEGQTITIKNVNITKKDKPEKPKTHSTATQIGVLPPPPGSANKIPLLKPPPAPSSSIVSATAANSSRPHLPAGPTLSDDSLLAELNSLGLTGSSQPSSTASADGATKPTSGTDDFFDTLAAAPGSNAAMPPKAAATNWVQF